MSEQSKISVRGITVWLVCAIFFTYEFLLRTVLGTFQHPIMADLNLTPLSFALLSSTAFIGIYGLMQMPVGFIADKFGLKKSLLFAVILCVVSTLFFAFTYEFKFAVIARMLMGFGASFGFICLLVSVYEWMPSRFYGLFIGLSQFIGTLGPMIAAGPFNEMAQNGSTDWRTIFLGLSLFGAALVIPVLFFVKNNQQNMGGFRVLSRSIPVVSSLKTILKQKQMWWIAIYCALVFFTIEYLSENEGKAYIELLGFSSSFASYMITVGWLGYAIGCPLLGFISDLLKRRKLVMLLGAVCCLGAMASLVYGPATKTSLMITFFMIGVGASAQSVGFAIMAEQCNKYYLAAGLGFNNAMIAFVSSVNAPFIGWLLEYHGPSHEVQLPDYVFAFNFVLGLITISIIAAMFFIKETYCRPTKEFTVVTSGS